jgi:hypothetical protein
MLQLRPTRDLIQWTAVFVIITILAIALLIANSNVLTSGRLHIVTGGAMIMFAYCSTNLSLSIVHDTLSTRSYINMGKLSIMFVIIWFFVSLSLVSRHKWQGGEQVYLIFGLFQTLIWIVFGSFCIVKGLRLRKELSDNS